MRAYIVHAAPRPEMLLPSQAASVPILIAVVFPHASRTHCPVGPDRSPEGQPEGKSSQQEPAGVDGATGCGVAGLTRPIDEGSGGGGRATSGADGGGGLGL